MRVFPPRPCFLTDGVTRVFAFESLFFATAANGTRSLTYLSVSIALGGVVLSVSGDREGGGEEVVVGEDAERVYNEIPNTSIKVSHSTLYDNRIFTISYMPDIHKNIHPELTNGVCHVPVEPNPPVPLSVFGKLATNFH